MSIRLFNAYKVADGKLSTAFRIKKALEPLYKAFVIETLHRHRNMTIGEIKKLLERESWYYMDEYSTSTLVELTYTELEIVCEKIMRIGLDWDLNFQASIVIFQDSDCLYIQFFGLTDPVFTKYIKRLKYKKVLADYYYTDVSDDEFDNPEYLERGKVWNRIYKGSRTPAQAGFSYDFWSRSIEILYEFLEAEREYRKGVKA
jgi:hypothetical protein